MDEPIVVHVPQALQNLKGNLACVRLRQGSREVPLQIATLKIFHRDEDSIVGLEPAIGLHKPIGILSERLVSDTPSHSQDINVERMLVAYLLMGEFSDGLQFPRVVDLLAHDHALLYFLDRPQLPFPVLLISFSVYGAECASTKTAVAKPSLSYARAPLSGRGSVDNL